MLYFNNHFNNFIANDKRILTNLDASDNLMISTLYKEWVSYLCRFLIIIWARKKNQPRCYKEATITTYKEF